MISKSFVYSMLMMKRKVISMINFKFLPAFLLSAFALPANAERVSMSLDGEWAIEESVGPEEVPTAFGHRVPVPGLAHLATPAFQDVDHYVSREYIAKKIQLGLLPESARIEALGTTRQKRNYFWYRTTFRPTVKKQVAILRVNKAQFGTAVWVNGKKVGEHLSCFTAGLFDITSVIKWDKENVLLVRIGAHPGALPEWAPAGTDNEKSLWTAGIYDSVALQLSDNPVIQTLQVAPRIKSSEIVVQTRLKNHGPPTTVDLDHVVKTWKGSQVVAQLSGQRISLKSGEVRTLTQTIRIPRAKLWTPESPFLYVLETATGGDNHSARFGMREFRFDSATRKAYLNDQIYYLRGASITLHRFFSDPASKQHPWEEAWVRKLLGEIPKRMHWNSFRLCIGPVPQMWLDIADEEGLLLQAEYAVWTGNKDHWRHELWKTEELIEQYTEFMQDHWNHPSVAIWDASNETTSDVLREKVIPAVRGLDLSNRPWDNGYSVPQGPSDPYEDHPYFFSNHVFQGSGLPPFRMTDLERIDGKKQGAAAPSGHAAIINEYGWLWLKRDGTPTFMTKNVYNNLLGPDATAEQRFAIYGYLLGGMTEFWRAHRRYAGIQYLAYLDGDIPDAYTCDNFRDVEKLELEANFEDYMKEAFKPVGVYINFWNPKLTTETKRRYHVMMINDEWESVKGKLELSFVSANGDRKVTTRNEISFEIPANGQMTYDITLSAPAAPGDYLLKAAAKCDGQPWTPVVSRRKVSVLATADALFTPAKKAP